MVFIPTADCIQAAVVYDGWPKELVNVFHFQTAGGLDMSEAELLRDMLDEVYSETWATSALALASIARYEFRDMSTDVGAVINLPPASPIVGVAAGPLPEVQTNVVVSWRSGFAGRTKRGRSYVPGFNIGWLDGQNISSGAAAAVQAWADTLIAAATAAVRPLVIVSKQLNGVPRTAGVRTLVATAQVNPQIGTQRRRILR